MTDDGIGGHPRGVRGSGAMGRDRAKPLTLEALYREHAGFVWRVVRRLGIPDEAAEDVVQEVFIVARRKLPQYEGRGAPTSWLYGIARGVCANVRRGRARADRRLRVVPPVEPEATPEDAVGRRDAVRLVNGFLAELPEGQRPVFELVDIEGVPGPDAARALGVPLNTLYSRLRLARRRFQAFLATHGIAEESPR